MILDQRLMSGGFARATPAAVRAYWDDFQSQPGFMGFRHRNFEQGLIETGETVAAFINESRWVATCPGCGDGIACWPENPDCCCLGCGRTYTAAFPPANERAQAERILLARPEEATRNWIPGEESVTDLKVENVVRGLPIAASAAADEGR
jgi:hypothetical protein